MNGLVVAPAFDSGGKHPHDATGAFQPGAKAFAKLHGLPAPDLINNHATPSARELALTSLITRTPGPLDVVAIFCHGMWTGLQLGPSTVTAGNFAGTLRAACSSAPVVCLYACDAGEDPREIGDETPVLGSDAAGAGNGSFADRLRDHLLAIGCSARIIAHATAGHAYKNPYVRVFDATTTDGGEWLIAPGSPEWRAWVHALRDTDLWATMPFLSRDEILSEIRHIT